MIKLLQALKDAGITAVIAGGAVRDQVRGVEPNDIDMWCLGDTSELDIHSILPLLDDAQFVDVGDYDEVLAVSKLVKGKFTDAQGKVRKVDIIVPAYHFHSPIELVSNFDYNINQGFIGLDCGVYKPDLTRLYAVRDERQPTERTERFSAMVQYYNDQQSAAKAFKDNDAAWLEDT
jgi:hypothetical protein